MTTAPERAAVDEERVRPVRRFLAAAAAASVGDGVRFAALPLLASALLRDPFQVAAVTAMTTAPWLLLGLPAGAYVDRTDRVRLMVVADVMRAGVLLLAFALLVADRLGLWELLVLAAVLGAGEVLFDCAAFAVLPSIVPGSRLESVNGKLFSIRTVGRDLAGHLLGGLLFSLSRAVPLLVNAGTFLVSALLLRGLPRVEHHVTADTPGMWRAIRDGISFIASDRLLVTLTLAAGVVNFVYLGQISIFVVFVEHELHVGPAGYPVFLAVGAAGGVVGGAVAGRLAERHRRFTVLVGGLGIVGVAGLLPFLGSVVATGIGFFFMSFGTMLWNVVSVALRQRIVPEALLGRTIGAYRLVSWGTMPLGALAFGALASSAGVRLTLGCGGILIVALAVVTGAVLRGEQRIDANASSAG